MHTLSKKISPVLFFLLFAFFYSCVIDGEGERFPKGEVEGYRPVYTREVDLTIAMTAPQEIVEPGKIYVKSDLLLLNDVHRGVHFIDNSDPAEPTKVGFLKVSGSTDMAIRNGIMYINQYEDILAIDITDLQSPRLVSREAGVLKVDGSYAVPPETGYYFECVEASKGYVIGWEKTIISNPKCYR